MERLTDRKTAADLKSNYEGLRAAKMPRDIGVERYIKLAEYENKEEAKPLTNREWLAAKSNFELADWLEDLILSKGIECEYCMFVQNGEPFSCNGGDSCIEGIELWLEAEHK